MSTPGTTAQPFILLRTKLYQPQVRSDWVRRPRLEKRMKQGLDREVAVIPVPAGFGNSGPAPSSLAKTDRHATSLSLNWGDNDPVWFQT